MALICNCLLGILLAAIPIAQAFNPTACTQITLQSTPNQPDSKVLRDATGNAKEIIKVIVWDQISQIPCVERVNYFYYGTILIAKNGCKATFKVCYEPVEQTTTPAPFTTIEPGCQKVRLLSRQNRPESKIVDSEVISMALLKDLHSKILCQFGVNFGFDNNIVFATGGCRGDFQVCTSGVQPLTTPAPVDECKKFRALRPVRRTVRDSNNQLATVTRLELVREISRDVCRKGVNFFFRGSLVVVNRGCKGVFRVCYEAPATTPAPITTASPEPECEKITVKSTKQRPGRVDVTDRNGNPVHIVHVHVWDQISRVKCVKGINYFYSKSSITTRHGCHATFKVCYQVTATTTPAPLTTTIPPQPGCDYVTLLSRQNRPASVRFPDSTIASMTLVRQFGKVDCIFRRTFGFRANRAIARRGCRGRFQICFDDTVPLTTASPEVCKDHTILKPTRKVVRDSNNQPATITSVTLVREISKHVCRKGVNYFFQGSQFVVTGGCKGVFTICYSEVVTTPAPLTTTEAPVVCDKVTVRSRGQRSNRVDVTDRNGNPVHIVHVHVWDQISKTKCVPWVNYFYADTYIIAQAGCHATFKVCYKISTTTPAPFTTQPPITCKRLQVLRPTRTTIRDSNGQPASILSVTLVREISRHVCEKGVNYFFRGSLFVVRPGCKGVFRICYSQIQTTPAPLTTTEAPTNCKKVTIKSTRTQNGRVDVTDRNGNPVEIVHVHVWDQISARKCIEWINYFYFESYVVVQMGCHATFKVCYTELATTTPAPLTTTAPPVKCRKYLILKHTRKIVVGSNGQPAAITRVNILHEISKGVCDRGTNFFFRGSLFVVNGGCKGKFRVCYEDQATTVVPLTTASPQPICKKVTVKSTATRDSRVDVTDANGNPVQIVHVHVWDQISARKCVQWINYVYSDSYIIAQKGCHATFKICYVPVATTTTPASITTAAPVRCKKFRILSNTRKIVRDANGQSGTITSVDLKKEISHKVCQKGVTYFYRGPRFVVRRGCKGVFRVCYTGTVATTTPAGLTTTAPPQKNCKKVTVKSTATHQGRVAVTDANGNPVKIVHVYVLNQISKLKCIEWFNYFYSGSAIIAKHGCKATFKVCYSGVLTTAAPLTTASPTKCRKFTLKEDGEREVKDSNGQPAVITEISLYREFSHDVCVNPDTFRVSGSSIQVDSGCKGVFLVCFLNAAPPSTPPALTTVNPDVKCRKYTFKTPTVKEFVLDKQPAEVVSVELVRELENGVCIEDTNYFYSGSTFTVQGTCKGVFKICIQPGGTQPLTTAPPGLTKECQKIKLDGSGPQPDSEIIVSSTGAPIVISSIQLIKEFSHNVCKEWINFFASGNTVVAKKGCYGKFKVCYTIL